jgi:hypothetical protein
VPPLKRPNTYGGERWVWVVGGQTKGKIVKWHVKVGDCIKENQLLFDVETNTLTVRADHRVGVTCILPSLRAPSYGCLSSNN